ncbi:MAG TPA: hypothetical protein VGU63_00580 [Candidatus Acidoferrales bacterium]|nr:hypothetical protein [Candidatus Acidoferrales bacterium]
MARLSYRQAYPNLSFRRRTSNWLSRLIRMPAECVHLARRSPWMATFLPDNLYLQGKNVPLRQPQRPEVSLCRECLVAELEKDLAAYSGRVVAFEPDGDSFTQYFFVAAPDFEAAGVEPAVAAVIGGRLARDDDRSKSCRECSRPATWLWFSREQIPNLDAADRMEVMPGEHFCAAHGAKQICVALASIEHVNLFYVNAPYGEGGAYFWI